MSHSAEDLEYMRRALILSRGDLTTFVTSPISAGLLLVSLVLLLLVLAPSIRKGREKAFQED